LAVSEGEVGSLGSHLNYPRLGCIGDRPRKRCLARSVFLRAQIRRLTTARDGELAGGFEYPAVNAAIARFEKRLKIDRELQKKIKRVAKNLKIEI
jgi:hypothetical protein